MPSAHSFGFDFGGHDDHLRTVALIISTFLISLPVNHHPGSLLDGIQASVDLAEALVHLAIEASGTSLRQKDLTEDYRRLTLDTKLIDVLWLRDLGPGEIQCGRSISVRMDLFQEVDVAALSLDRLTFKASERLQVLPEEACAASGSASRARPGRKVRGNIRQAYEHASKLTAEMPLLVDRAQVRASWPWF